MPSEQELLSDITRRHEAVKTIFDAADERKAQGGDDALTTTEYETVTGHNREIEKIEIAVKDLREQREQQRTARDQFRQRDADLRRPVNGLGAGKTGEDQDETKAGRRRKSAGQVVLEDPEFKAWHDQYFGKGRFSTAKFGSSPRVNLPGGAKALITGTSTTSAGAMIPSFEMYPTPPTGFYARPLTIRDLVTTGTTEADAIEYAIEGTFTNAAAPVAEATASSGSSGAKPESSMAWTQTSTSVKTIAHWIPVTRRALADAGQLQMYIESFLRYGLDEELEDQMLGGSGSGENFTGIRNTSGIQTQAWDTDILTTLRRARTKVRVTGRSTPTAYVLHPNDWEDIDLLKDNEGRYYYGGPSVLGQPRLWGLPVVESEGETEGFGHVADWRRAVLLDREQAQIFVSDSHSDFFTRNLVAVLAELRAAFFVLRPSAFVEADLTA
jgi:HK97 family phage major capsid protein